MVGGEINWEDHEFSNNSNLIAQIEAATDELDVWGDEAKRGRGRRSRRDGRSGERVGDERSVC